MIIRGGGAVNDLAYLNDYELAALLVKQTVPIWVSIGHEKDRTILDEVANRSFDTPSKVIGGIRNLIAERTQDVLDSFKPSSSYLNIKSRHTKAKMTNT